MTPGPPTPEEDFTLLELQLIRQLKWLSTAQQDARLMLRNHKHHP